MAQNVFWIWKYGISITGNEYGVYKGIIRQSPLYWISDLKKDKPLLPPSAFLSSPTFVSFYISLGFLPWLPEELLTIKPKMNSNSDSKH